MKVCSKCGAEKPLADFHRDKQKADGFRPDCKLCVNLQNKNYRANNPEKAAAQRKAYREKNPERCAQYSRTYRETHPERVIEHRRARHARNPEKNRLFTKLWAARNPERRKAIRRVYRINKRARLKGVEGRFSALEFQKILAAQGGKCYWCGCALSEENLHRDHYIPLARGGHNDTTNFVASCADCNRTRRDMLPAEFIAQKGREA